jgi:hypothetical protein
LFVLFSFFFFCFSLVFAQQPLADTTALTTAATALAFAPDSAGFLQRLPASAPSLFFFFFLLFFSFFPHISTLTGGSAAAAFSSDLH